MAEFSHLGRILNYDLEAPDIAVRQSVVVLLNGMSHRMDAWSLMLPYLERVYRVLRMDFYGQGKTIPDPSECSLRQQAADVAALLQHLEIEKAHVIGLSYGGMVAQHLAYHYRDVVARLSLASTMAWSDPVANSVTQFLRQAQEMGGFEMRFLASLPWQFSAQFLGQKPDFINTFKTMLASSNWDAIANLAIGAMEHDARGWLNTLPMPVQIVVGQEDRYTPVQQAELLYSLIEDARLEIIEHAGHSLHIEAPEAFALKVIRFASDTGYI